MKYKIKTIIVSDNSFVIPDDAVILKVETLDGIDFLTFAEKMI